jgi:hypothetical protein
MRRHIYIAVNDRRLEWLKEKIICYDIFEVYGQHFHMLEVAKQGEYTVIEIINVNPRSPMRRLYRFLKRENYFGVLGPFTPPQLMKAYPKFVARHLTNGTLNEAKEWTPGKEFCPKRQVAGDPNPIEQAKWDYEPTIQEIAVDRDDAKDLKEESGEKEIAAEAVKPVLDRRVISPSQ